MLRGRGHYRRSARGPGRIANRLPALGYTVPQTIGNILLTAWGPVMVPMMV